MHRLEWFLGIPELKASYQNSYIMSNSIPKVGVDLMESLQSEVLPFKSNLFYSHG